MLATPADPKTTLDPYEAFKARGLTKVEKLDWALTRKDTNDPAWVMVTDTLGNVVQYEVPVPELKKFVLGCEPYLREME